MTLQLWLRVSLVAVDVPGELQSLPRALPKSTTAVDDCLKAANVNVPVSPFPQVHVEILGSVLCGGVQAFAKSKSKPLVESRAAEHSAVNLSKYAANETGFISVTLGYGIWTSGRLQ